MILNCYIFNRNGRRIFYREYHRTCNAFEGNPEEESKLICGFLLSMNALIEKFSINKWAVSSWVHGIERRSTACIPSKQNPTCSITWKCPAA